VETPASTLFSGPLRTVAQLDYGNYWEPPSEQAWEAKGITSLNAYEMERLGAPMCFGVYHGIPTVETNATKRLKL
jgi:hypothetical protein